jgi:dTDP-4-amino-4,6-dideoxygalactose transaminase
MIYTFAPKLQYKSIKKDIYKNIAKVLNSGNYILGKEVKKFEKDFAKYNDVKYAVSTKNGTDSLILVLKALGVDKGDEVITTAHTALATIASIVSVGAKPVILDIEKKYYTLDPENITKSISKKTKAIIPVHIYGQSCDMHKIKEISKKFKIPIIEDCAQSIGASFHKKKVGGFGIASCFSFYPTKNLGAIGDGGMILTNNKKIFNKLTKIRQYGWDNKRNANLTGINSRLDEIQAVILSTKLKNIYSDNKKRNYIANKYFEKIENKKIILPLVRKNSVHSFHIFAILVKNRKRFLTYMEKNKIKLTVHYKNLTFFNKGYKVKCKYNYDELINAKIVSKETVSLPIYPELKKNELDKIIKIVNSYR